MKRIAGYTLMALGGIGYAVFGLWGFVLTMAIVAREWGFLGAVIAFMFAPITFTVAPWYEGVTRGNWLPLAVCYGGLVVASIFWGPGSALLKAADWEEDTEWRRDSQHQDEPPVNEDEGPD